jgi:hypothetical protein
MLRGLRVLMVVLLLVVVGVIGAQDVDEGIEACTPQQLTQVADVMGPLLGDISEIALNDDTFREKQDSVALLALQWQNNERPLLPDCAAAWRFSRMADDMFFNFMAGLVYSYDDELSAMLITRASDNIEEITDYVAELEAQVE